MSYLRMGQNGSSVYVFMHSDGCLTCWWCTFLESEHFNARSTQEMIDHLKQHRDAGDCVPDFEEVAARLRRHDAENFPHHSVE